MGSGTIMKNLMRAHKIKVRIGLALDCAKSQKLNPKAACTWDTCDEPESILGPVWPMGGFYACSASGLSGCNN